jgi:hypothetical protein
MFDVMRDSALRLKSVGNAIIWAQEVRIREFAHPPTPTGRGASLTGFGRQSGQFRRTLPQAHCQVGVDCLRVLEF